MKTSYRGKSLAYQRDAGLFQWSAAVKAFAILAVGTRASVSTSRNLSLMTLEGEGGSPAATLDYAIAKPTSWIVDLFGRESNGKSYARLVFKRENSERKRPGPVRVALCTQLHNPAHLRIFLNGVELLTAQELLALHGLLSEASSSKHLKNTESESTPIFQATWFKDRLHDEVQFSLRETELLDRLGIEEVCEQNAAAEPSKKSFGSAIQKALLGSMPPSPTSTRSAKKPRLKLPCRIACSPAAVGALTLFNRLRLEHDEKLSINAAFPSTRAILESDDLASYSLIALSWGAAKLLYRREKFTRFRPVMLLPSTSLGLILRRELSSSKQVKKVLLATEPDGYPMRVLSTARSHELLPTSVEPISASFSEIMSLLPRKADAAIAAFPISHLVARRHSAKVLWEHDQIFRCGTNILFARKTLDIHEVAAHFRESWYTLLEDTSALQDALNRIFSDIDFTNYLYRLAALYHVRG